MHGTYTSTHAQYHIQSRCPVQDIIRNMFPEINGASAAMSLFFIEDCLVETSGILQGNRIKNPKSLQGSHRLWRNGT